MLTRTYPQVNSITDHRKVQRGIVGLVRLTPFICFIGPKCVCVRGTTYYGRRQGNS
jgi:hypothetical protein